ncbi:hypothetical protein NUW58_g6017 [Xylaria curta]|uniref:Uncharacterized protein n=1 Tax=Xylaria curta TaxID=42375 RepID=A0ACC1NYU0_9PEZI|nr:hypothetical protein NUW58_g6017 [Xylaria curta]
MKSASVFGNEAHSQPVFSSHMSPYFHHVDANFPVSQGSGRLYPPRGLSRSPMAIASPMGSLTSLQLQQPHPFFGQGTAAMGFLPSPSPQYLRHLGSQEPIIPLRTAFSSAGNAHPNDRPIALRELEQDRPHSVPSHYTHTPGNIISHPTQEIPGPTSVVPISSQSLTEFNDPEGGTPVEGDKNTPGGSLPEPNITGNLGFEDDRVPPKRTLPFPTTKQIKAQTESSGEQLKTVKIKSPSLKLAPTAVQKAKQAKTKKTTSPPKRKKRPQHLSDALTDDRKTSKRPTKIRLVTKHADNKEKNPQVEHSTSVAQENKKASQESQPSQLPQKNSQGHSISNSLSTNVAVVDTSVAHAGSSSGKEPPQPHSVTINEDTETQVGLAMPSVDPGHTSTTLASSLLRGRQDRSAVGTLGKRSASQVTTVSATSTRPSHTTEDEDLPESKDSLNPMSLIDETMVLERDISDIVSTRLREGNRRCLGAMCGEILIKMAVKDETLCDRICSILKSGNEVLRQDA